jgi:hypothetical protein
MGLSSLFGMPVGYYIGRITRGSTRLPRQCMWFGAGLFGSAAFAHKTQEIAARLMGLLPNDEEVRATGTERKGK